MKTFTLFIAFSLFVCLLAGCSSLSADRRAMLPTKVSFVPEVVSALESSTTRPIKLTEAQATAVCGALRGSLHTDFCNNQMEPELLASWWYVQTNAIAIVRWKKDRSGYLSVAFDQQGRLLFDGGGRDLNTYSPWTK